MIETLSAFLADLSPAAIIALLVLALVQCILQVYLVVDLIRRPAVPGGNKWLWGLLIVAGGLLGCLIYLGLGRNLSVLLETDEGAGGEKATRRAVDKLYGDRK